LISPTRLYEVVFQKEAKEKAMIYWGTRHERVSILADSLKGQTCIVGVVLPCNHLTQGIADN